ncbi:unnamed protein product [Paramecium pentaurelia]|uniref:EF-hand domain-containing protein n=1 Tax=Paramecium pentaurelia TaxID=43138 RepID=A0A8S1UGM7_9CILI|nr:unnamed protein product [Paramecium pentaurelia]
MNFYFFIQLAVEAELKLEEMRILLANLDNFEPFTTYKRLDQRRTGGLKSDNIFEFLNDNDIQITQDQLDYMFRVLDEDSDGLVSFQDFKRAILPKMNDQVKDQALNHKSYDLPVNMLLPKEIEAQLSQFFIQIKQNYIQYQQIEQKIDLNQLDIYDKDNYITINSLKFWLQQLGKDIKEEILQNFIIIIQGQKQWLQKLLDQIYTKKEKDQDQFHKQREEENFNKDHQENDEVDIEKQKELKQFQQNDAETDIYRKISQLNNQQELQSQVFEHNKTHNYDLHYDIEFEICQLKNKIYDLEIQLEIPSQLNRRSQIGQMFEKVQNKELQQFSRMSYLKIFDYPPSEYGKDLITNLDNFEPFTTYKRLDQRRTGGLKSDNIFEFLNDNDIQITQDQLDYMFRVLDEDSDGLVSFQDFKRAILPKMNDQVKDQALNHKSYDLPVNMLLPKEIEAQLSQFFIQIKQNYIQYQQIEQKIDLNQLDIYDKDNYITINSLKFWLQQLGKDIKEEILQNFIIIIQGQKQWLQKLLDQIYTKKEKDQDQFHKQREEENFNKDHQENDEVDIEKQKELKQFQQNDAETDIYRKISQLNNQQELQSQVFEHNKTHNYDLHYDIEFEICQLKNKIYDLEIQLEIPSQLNRRSQIGQMFEKVQNKELQQFSRMSYLKIFDYPPSEYGKDLISQKLQLDKQIKKEQIKQQILL